MPDDFGVERFYNQSRPQSVAPVAASELVSPDLERSLLGSLLQMPELLDFLPMDFSPTHYGLPRHGEIHLAIQAVGKPKRPALHLVCNALASDAEERRSIANMIGKAIAFTGEDIAQFARAITDRYMRRALVELLGKVSQEAAQGSLKIPSAALIGKLCMRLDQLTSATALTQEPVTISQAIDKAVMNTQEALLSGRVVGSTTGFPVLDAALRKMRESQLILLGGRPGMGKTAIALQIALAAGKEADALTKAGDKCGVAMMSLEMSTSELGERAACLEADLGAEVFADAALFEASAAKIMEARYRLAQVPFLIDDTPAQNIAGIKLRCRSAIRRLGRLHLVVIDHLHIMKGENTQERRHSISDTVNGCKELAKTFRCPVLLLAQLGRDVARREDKRPNMSDFLESGAIEAAADAVLFVHREEYYLQETAPARKPGQNETDYANAIVAHNNLIDNVRGQAELIIDKARGGKKQIIKLHWHGSQTRFSDPNAVDEPPDDAGRWEG